jgi:uncharacterized protein YacL
MSTSSWFRAFLSGLVGIAIGVIFTAVVNLLSPLGNLVQTVILVCVSAFLSAFLGFIFGSRKKKTGVKP